MTDILRMDRAALERMVAERLAATHDAQNDGRTPLNTRPADSDDESVPTNASRFSVGRGAQRPQIKPEDARNVMRFFQAFTNGDHTGAREALVKMGHRATTLQQVGVSADGGTTLPNPFVTEVQIDLPNA